MINIASMLEACWYLFGTSTRRGVKINERVFFGIMRNESFL